MQEQSFTDRSFRELNLSSSIERAVRELGYETMTPIQARAIPALMEGRDIIGQAQTGTGKTAAFGLPILQRIDPENKHLQAIVLCPTRELAMQAAGDLRSFAKYMHDVRVLPVYGGQDISRQIKALPGVQIIVGTPGRVMDHMRRKTIRMDHVSMVVLDEADEMLDMGFREDMEVILGAIDHPHQTCLFSATMPQPILELTEKYQQTPELIKVTPDVLTLDNIHQYYYAVKFEYKTLALLRLLSYYRYNRVVIFCSTKSMVDELATTLQEEGYTAEGLHGDLTQKQRDYVMGRFRAGSLTCLIATDIAARGIDVDDVEAVFNYDLPSETEYYVHRIGRTGRAGKEGFAHTICRSRDFRKIHEIEDTIHAKMEERRIPSPMEIREARRAAVLDRVTETLNKGRSGYLIPVVREYCREHELPLEDFAAAFLKMELGDDALDTVEIDLPARPEPEERSDRKGRGRRENPFKKFEEAGKPRREKRLDRFEKGNDFHGRKGDRKDSKPPKHRKSIEDAILERFEKGNTRDNKKKHRR